LTAVQGLTPQVTLWLLETSVLTKAAYGSRSKADSVGLACKFTVPLNSVQILRAVAALGVLVAHMFGGVGQFGVDLFFVISGFIIVYSMERYYSRPGASLAFARKRLIRIVPMYWIATAVLLAHVLLTYPSLSAANMSVQQIVASLLFVPWAAPSGAVVPVHGVGWSLNYEFFFYVLFAGAVILPRIQAVLAVTVVLVAGALFTAIYPLPLPLGYWFQPIVLEFIMGMGLALLFRTGFQLPGWARAALVGLAIGALALNLGLPRVLIWGLPAVALVAAAVLGTDVPRVWGLSRLGDASYSLYLLHPFVLAVPRIALGPELATTTPVVLLGGVAACLVAVLAYGWVERPITRALGSAIAPPNLGQAGEGRLKWTRL
jgi:exopolysaccharide production protein ExoZ